MRTFQSCSLLPILLILSCRCLQVKVQNLMGLVVKGEWTVDKSSFLMAMFLGGCKSELIFFTLIPFLGRDRAMLDNYKPPPPFLYKMSIRMDGFSYLGEGVQSLPLMPHMHNCFNPLSLFKLCFPIDWRFLVDCNISNN